MRKILLVVVALECAALAGGAAIYLLGGLERFRRLPPPVPVFVPPIHDARIGDLVRYERRDRAGRVLGYLEYAVKLVLVAEGTTVGPEILLDVRETDAGGGSRHRLMRVQPRALAHGFLPPQFEEDDDYPSGARPVVSRIASAKFALPHRPRAPPVHGFLVEAVIPRKSLREVAERFWITGKVPVFGVARWERGDEVLVLHHMEPKRR